MQARGHAALGQDDPCREQLRQAERVLGSAVAGHVSPWVSHFDEASLAAEAARCFGRLGRLDAARHQAEQVVELRPRERARSRAFAQLMLISILIAQGRPDEARAVAYDVLDATRTLSSYLVVRQFEDLQERFAPYERSREVAAFLDCLREELRERRWLADWLPSTDAHPNGPAAP
jgi:ATP/maltotriose-dependent transcriptional regulator MalT